LGDFMGMGLDCATSDAIPGIIARRFSLPTPEARFAACPGAATRL
jgi:hypothetical protein